MTEQPSKKDVSSDNINAPETLSQLVATSAIMREIFATSKRVAPFLTTVLITGESGTGKELLARAIHDHSPRCKKRFVAVNCGAIPETLMESELFGHKKGAFTDATRDKKGLFEEADGGTLFLDEIGELALHLQVKILRALQERKIQRVGDEQQIPIDVRVVTATLRDLEQDVAFGRFREDLYYRLNVVSIHLPALRERKDDVPLLIDHFIEKHSKRLGIETKIISTDIRKILLDYHWPGNARELENCIERALVLSPRNEVELESLPHAVLAHESRMPQNVHFSFTDKTENLSVKEHTKNLEISLIQLALKRTNGNRTHAAKILEISHRALLYKIKEYGLGD